MPVSKEAIAAELIRRGVDPEIIRAKGYGTIADQARAGFIVPKVSMGDKVGDRQVRVNEARSLNEQRDKVAPFANDLAQVERFVAINREQPTGGIQHKTYDTAGEKINPLNWPGMVGNAFMQFDPEYQELSGIASGLQGKARPAGSGATSDFEQRLYRMGVPSPEKDGRVNQSIATYMKGVMAEENDRLAFEERFLAANGTRSGAQAAWSRYVEANPYIVTTKSRGMVRTVPNRRRTDWQTAFGLAPASRSQGGRGGGRGGGAPARSDPLGIRGGK